MIPLNQRRRAMQKRLGFKQNASLGERLASFAKSAREKAARLVPGVERDELLRKARRADPAYDLYAWINSPELQPPR
jgi:hypothetical protein